jgi:hypothetical protein
MGRNHLRGAARTAREAAASALKHASSKAHGPKLDHASITRSHKTRWLEVMQVPAKVTAAKISLAR